MLFAKKFKSVAEFVEAVREGKFEAPQLSFDGPSWHRKMFGKSVGKMLRLNVEERASAGELVEMFEGMGKVERKRLRRRHFSM